MSTIETRKRVENGMARSTPKVDRRLSRDFFLLYLPTALCFLVINITNDRILSALARHGFIYGKDTNFSNNLDKTTRFFLVPSKSLLFFVSTAILIYYLLPAFKRILELFKRQTWVRLLLPMLICSALTFNYAPLVFGRSYARISTDPFNQGVDQLYRRLLLPALANLYHVDGFFSSSSSGSSSSSQSSRSGCTALNGEPSSHFCKKSHSSPWDPSSPPGNAPHILKSSSFSWH